MRSDAIVEPSRIRAQWHPFGFIVKSNGVSDYENWYL